MGVQIALTHMPLIHDTFPKHFDTLVKGMFLTLKNQITECTPQLAGLVIAMVLYKAQ
jgi:hypothetical protein